MMLVEHSINTLNRILEMNNIPYSPFKIVWNTTLGPATLELVKYHPDDENLAVLEVDSSNIKIHYVTSSFTKKENDLFSFVQHKIMRYFVPNDGFGLTFDSKIHMIKEPDVLLNKIIEIAKECAKESYPAPNYNTIWNFESLDKNMKLPFITSKTIDVFEPISLISKN